MTPQQSTQPSFSSPTLHIMERELAGLQAEQGEEEDKRERVRRAGQIARLNNDIKRKRGS